MKKNGQETQHLLFYTSRVSGSCNINIMLHIITVYRGQTEADALENLKSRRALSLTSRNVKTTVKIVSIILLFSHQL